MVPKSLYLYPYSLNFVFSLCFLSPFSPELLTWLLLSQKQETSESAVKDQFRKNYLNNPMFLLLKSEMTFLTGRATKQFWHRIVVAAKTCFLKNCNKNLQLISVSRLNVGHHFISCLYKFCVCFVLIVLKAKKKRPFDMLQRMLLLK